MLHHRPSFIPQAVNTV